VKEINHEKIEEEIRLQRSKLLAPETQNFNYPKSFENHKTETSPRKNELSLSTIETLESQNQNQNQEKENQNQNQKEKETQTQIQTQTQTTQTQKENGENIQRIEENSKEKQIDEEPSSTLLPNDVEETKKPESPKPEIKIENNLSLLSEELNKHSSINEEIKKIPVEMETSKLESIQEPKLQTSTKNDKKDSTTQLSKQKESTFSEPPILVPKRSATTLPSYLYESQSPTNPSSISPSPPNNPAYHISLRNFGISPNLNQPQHTLTTSYNPSFTLQDEYSNNNQKRRSLNLKMYEPNDIMTIIDEYDGQSAKTLGPNSQTNSILSFSEIKFSKDQLKLIEEHSSLSPSTEIPKDKVNISFIFIHYFLFSNQY
jgi:hypothetical protein